MESTNTININSYNINQESNKITLTFDRRVTMNTNSESMERLRVMHKIKNEDHLIEEKSKADTKVNDGNEEKSLSESKEDYSFQQFVEHFQNSTNNLGVSWNKERDYYMKEVKNKQKIILKEINQFDSNDPLKSLDESYVKDSYNTNLLVNEMKNLENIFSERTYEVIIEKREKLEMIKKILEYYLNYVVEINFESISKGNNKMRALKKLGVIEVNILQSLQSVQTSKSKFAQIKQKVLLSSAKFLLYKQKLKNLLQIHHMIKDKLLNWWSIFNQSRKKKSLNKFTFLFNNYSRIKNEVTEWSGSGNKSNKSSVIGNSKSNSPFNQFITTPNPHVFKKRNLMINDILLQKAKDKLNKLQIHVEKQMNNLFIEKKENFLECYDYFLQNPNNSKEKYLDIIDAIFKKSIFNIIKGTLTSFTEDSKSYLTQELQRIRDIAKLKFEETKLVAGFNQLLKNLSKICQCYHYIIETSSSKAKDDKEREMIQFIVSKSNLFYERMEKKFSKVLSYFNPMIREMNGKNLMYIVVYNCLFLEMIKYTFRTDYSKYLHLQTKNLVLDGIKMKNLQNIKKVGILLGGDIWKRVALQEDHEFFSHNKLQERTPFFVRNFLTIFNEVSFFLNKNNIKDMFPKYMEVFSVYSSNEHNLTSFINDEIKVNILSKQLNNKSIILSSSTITLIKSLLDLVVDLAFFDAITFEIFVQIFNLVDYYILAGLNMFVDKKYFNMLFEEISVEEVKKKGKYEYSVDLVLFQKRFANLRRYLNSTKKSLETLFEVEIDLLKSSYDNNENYEANEFYLPKLNSQIIINDSNIYSCMVESIILFESFVSVRKILKRLLHFTKKIELEFQSKMIIDRIDNYTLVLDEIKDFIYRPICQNIFKIEPVLNKIVNYKWDLKDSEMENQFSEANQFIDNLFQEICEKYDKLYILSGGSLTEKSQKRFLDVILMFMIEKLMETFSKIKKCNSSGRSIMLKDIKFFKSKIEGKYNKDVHGLFGDLELYINSWYCTEDEFLKYIEDTHLNYKYLNGILNTGQNFVKLSRQQRKDFQSRLDDTYLLILENIKISMLDG